MRWKDKPTQKFVVSSGIEWGLEELNGVKNTEVSNGSRPGFHFPLFEKRIVSERPDYLIKILGSGFHPKGIWSGFPEILDAENSITADWRSLRDCRPSPASWISILELIFGIGLRNEGFLHCMPSWKHDNRSQSARIPRMLVDTGSEHT